MADDLVEVEEANNSSSIAERRRRRGRVSKLADSSDDEAEEEDSTGKRDDKDAGGVSTKLETNLDSALPAMFSPVVIRTLNDVPPAPDGDLSDREWKESVARGEEGVIEAPRTERARKLLSGFEIKGMKMSDADTGVVLWKTDDWDKERFSEESDAVLPKEILDLEAVSREITFSSVEAMTDFHLEQKIFLHAQCIEEWTFKFGFVIPNSTNSWQQTIHRAPKTIPPEILSGNLTIETGFYDQGELICKSVLRVYYK